MEMNPEIFKGKRFQDLLEDIYKNSQSKKNRIETLANTLMDLIQNDPRNAAFVVPIFKDLVDVEIRSDEHLVKVAAIIQRLISTQMKESGGSLDQFLSDDEKNRLIQEALVEANKSIEKELEETETEDEEIEELEKALRDVKKKTKGSKS